MGGILGRLFREFAVTICAAILISGVVSITLTPMLCSRFLRAPSEEPTAVYRATERFFDWHAARLRPEPALGAAPPPGHAGGLRRRAGRHRLSVRRRFPRDSSRTTDNDQIYVNTEAAQGTSFYQMVEVPAASRRHRAPRIPNVESFMSSVGGGNSAVRADRNQAACIVQLKPRAAAQADGRRRWSKQLRPKLSRIPGHARVHDAAARPSASAAACPSAAYDFTLQGPDTAELYTRGAEAGAADRARCPRCRTSTRDLQIKNPAREHRDRPRQGGRAAV